MHFLVYAVLTFFCVVNISAARETNAQRLSRGLSPLRPKFRSILPGFSPTRVLGAKRHSPSSAPLPPSSKEIAGRIQVRSADGRGLGYLRNWAGPSPINGVNFGGEDEDLQVSFTLPIGKNGPFDILATNPNFEEPYYAGVSSTVSSGETLAAGQPNGIAFINVQQTPPGSPPVHNETTGTYVESAIWYFDSTTKQITPQYINPDGNKPPTTIAYNIRSNQLFIVGDLNAWNSQHPNTPSSAVAFHLEDV